MAMKNLRTTNLYYNELLLPSVINSYYVYPLIDDL